MFSPHPQVLSSLLTEIQAALDIHSSPAVLEAAARTYLYLCSKETTWSSIVRDKRDSVVQTWVDQLTVLLGESLRVKRIYTLYVRFGSLYVMYIYLKY